MAASGVWAAYHEPENHHGPVVLAMFSSELSAARYALENTQSDRIVRCVQVPFGVPVAEAIASGTPPATPAQTPKPRASQDKPAAKKSPPKLVEKETP